MTVLSSNRELYEYLRLLAMQLKARGSNELAQIVEVALGNASSLSTEFLGESRLALRQVRDRGQSVLSSQENADLLGVLRQLDQAFDRR